MFGDPLRAVLESQMANANKTNPKPSPETLKLIEAVLDYIRANLNNIRNTWGPDSPQYKSAAEIMDKYLESNLKSLNVDKNEMEVLMEQMQGLGLGRHSPAESSSSGS